MRTGHARWEITPDRDCPLIGYDQRAEFFPEGGNLGVHDPLFADALVLEDDRQRVVLVTLDLCILETPLATQLRRSIGEAAGTTPDTVVLACSHTHSGPYPWQPGWERTEPVPDLLHGVASRRFRDFLENALPRLARTAADSLVPTSVVTRATTIGMAYNRRVRLPDGAVGMVWDLREWAGPAPAPAADPHLQMVLLRRAGAADVLLWNIAAHPVVLGKRSNVVSADWPGAARAMIETGRPDTRAMFLHGAGGDAHPWLATGENPADLETVAAPVARLLLLHAAVAGRGDTAPRLGVATSTQCTALRIGPARLVAFPCELFGATGFALRRTYSDLLLATTANGWLGYCPPHEEFAVGGYEVESAIAIGNSPHDCSRLVSEAVHCLEQL